MTSILAELPQQERRLPWPALASLLLHGAVLALTAFVLTSRDNLVPPPEPPAVAVEIVTPAEFAALQPPAEAPPPIIASPAPAAEAAPAVTADRLAPSAQLAPDIAENPTVTATRFYAADLLQQPAMQRIRQGLRGFADSERLIQICNIEALEQIRRAAPDTAPDTMVAYAMADLLSSGMTLTATGGAFRSRRRWFGIAFNCTVASGYEAVTAFDFKLGDAIPESEWEAHNLNAADEDE
jgi:hypothetical protein